MANWCINGVIFYSENEEAVNKVKRIFYDMIRREKEEEQGQKPLNTEPERFFFFTEIESESEQSITIRYETKWAPNTGDLIAIAKETGCDFNGWYEELGDMLFGEFDYVNGEFYSVDLTYEETKDIVYDEDGNAVYKGEVWESETELLEHLLEKKKRK